MPLFHGNALASNFVPALTSGATIALRRRFSASAFLDDLRDVGATYFNTVGRALSYVLATPPTPHDRDHHVKFALAPESSPADVARVPEAIRHPTRRRLRLQRGRDHHHAGVGTRSPVRSVCPQTAQTSRSSIPRRASECPRAEFDEHGRLINASDAIGEIVRRDPALVFEGYYNNDDATAERNRNGWYWSGDLGYRDDEGIFYFAGRSADWMRVDGENFASAPIERILGRHPDVAAVAVYGVPDPVTGDQVMAALELRPGRAFDAGEFAEFLVAQRDLGSKWAPRFVRVVDALPVTGADKIAKLPLRAAGWDSGIGEVWWRPARDAAYELLTDTSAAAIAREFAQHGRAELLSNAAFRESG